MSAPPPTSVTRSARALADALDDSMRRRHTARIDRLLPTAERLCHGSPRLAEVVARAHLLHDRADRALEIIERVPMPTSSLRLLRIVCLLRAGRRLDAHADLTRWSSHPGAPLDARILLAGLDRASSEPRRAVDALARNTRQLDDPDALELMAALAVEDGRAGDARAWFERLLRARQRTDIERCAFLAIVFGLAREVADAPLDVGDDSIEHVALAAVAHEAVLPALVAAEVIDPEPERLLLLERTIETARAELRRPARADALLARLALVRGDVDAAERLVRRGWSSDPIEPDLVEVQAALDARQAGTDPITNSERSVLGRIAPIPSRPEERAA